MSDSVQALKERSVRQGSEPSERPAPGVEISELRLALQERAGKIEVADTSVPDSALCSICGPI
jgi:hypothetical protein